MERPAAHLVQAFHALIGQPTQRQAPGGISVAEVFERFLDWCRKHRAERTYQDHRQFIQTFLDESPGVAGLAATALRPFHVVEWVDHHPTWGAAFRRNAIVAVQRAYNWAVELGHLNDSPVRKIKKPQVPRREQVVSPEQWPTIRDRYSADDPFRALLSQRSRWLSAWRARRRVAPGGVRTTGINPAARWPRDSDLCPRG